MPDLLIRVAIFSYNRPRHLANCVKSISDMWPDADIVIYDDRSTVLEMKEVLLNIGHPVVTGVGGRGRHGGLYDNMQLAYETAMSEGFTHLLSIQDDMQLVRPVTKDILDEYAATFRSDEAICQIQSTFSRTDTDKSRASDEGTNASDPLTQAEPKPAPVASHADIGLFDLQRLAKLGWSFRVDGAQIVSGELTNSLKAAELGMKLVPAYRPIAMQLPFPDLYRHRLRLPRLSGVRKRIYTYEYMSDEAKARMDSRDPSVCAYWRRYLTVANTNWFDRWLLSAKNDTKILQ